jgi:Mg2+ and Co2+ transporter CorA
VLAGENDDDNGGGDDGTRMETEPTSHPGEYTNENDAQESQPTTVVEDPESRGRDTQRLEEPPKKKKSKKKKTQITFEEFESISNAIATYLRSLESDDEEIESKYLTWKEVVDWYLEQREEEIGDSMEELERMRKMLNLVIRR